MYIKFKHKLLLILVFILTGTILTTSILWYKHTKKVLTVSVTESVENILNERTRELGKIIKDIDYKMNVLAINNPIVDRCLGNKWEDAYLKQQAYKKLDDHIHTIYASNPVIQSIEVSNWKGESFSRGEKVGFNYIEENNLDELIKGNPDNLIILPHYDESEQIKSLMFFRNVQYYGHDSGYVSIQVGEYDIDEIFREALPQDSVIIIENQFKNTIYQSDNKKTIDHIMPQTHELQTAHTIITDGNLNKWLIMQNKLIDIGITIKVVISMNKLYTGIKGTFKDIIFIIMIMNIILLIVVYAVSRWMGKNITTLTDALQDFSRGNMDRRVAINSRDEFSILAKEFNAMTVNIKQLLKQIKAEEKEKMALEIRALQGQINMHFLFNTLNTVKNLCYIQRVTNVEQLVNALMELLHVSMEDGNDYVTLETEMTYIEHYLEIYKYKSIQPINCCINIEEGIEHVKILKFMIQPIVENAIIHGLEGSGLEKEGIIIINAARQENDIIISVIDNGKGFDTHKMSKFNGIGIDNTNKRIKKHFGQDYGITVESIEGISATVHVKIPKGGLDDKHSDSR